MNLKMRLLIIKHLRILRFKGATRAIRFWGSLILTERQLAVGFESQRDSVSKPRVASRELPWVNAPKHRPTPNGVASGQYYHVPSRPRGEGARWY